MPGNAPGVQTHMSSNPYNHVQTLQDNPDTFRTFPLRLGVFGTATIL
jgi:hypothetical protein